MADVQIIGMRIKDVRRMTKKELSSQCWDGPAMVIILENGVKLFPSSDEEGNSAGVLFGTSKDGQFGLW